jgi:hypothetical protein
MPRRNKGPRLWLRSERRRNGKVIAKTAFIILDGGKHIATGCSGSEAEAAERVLAA